MFNSRISHIESPCYNRETKTDCPRRCAGCAVDCPDWAAHVSERDKVYKDRKIQRDVGSVMYESRHSKIDKRNVNKIIDGRRHRR